MNKTLFALSILAATTASLSAIDINFTDAGTDTANGFLDFADTADTDPGANFQFIFTNVGGLGFDVVVTSDQAPTSDAAAGTATDTMVLPNAAGTYTISFFDTGTTDAHLVTGVDYSFRDLDAGETILGFSFVDQFGNPAVVPDSAITVGNGASIAFPNSGIIIGANGSPTPFAAEAGAGTADIDLTTTPLSSFTFNANPGADNIFLSQGLGGNIQTFVPVPIPFESSPALAMAAFAGLMGMRIRRRMKAE